ncbi:MAG: von Willebrand factor type A domain-containing protein, partial [Planctomycetes bacterium]|nr:von Willebrand factor type A domain-containing protein [Planctomycetota bacterium]
MSNIKSIGTSFKVYADDGPNDWGPPPHQLQYAIHTDGGESLPAQVSGADASEYSWATDTHSEDIESDEVEAFELSVTTVTLDAGDAVVTTYSFDDASAQRTSATYDGLTLAQNVSPADVHASFSSSDDSSWFFDSVGGTIVGSTIGSTNDSNSNGTPSVEQMGLVFSPAHVTISNLYVSNAGHLAVPPLSSLGYVSSDAGQFRGERPGVLFADGHASFNSADGLDFEGYADAASTQASVTDAFWTLVRSGDVTIKQFVTPSTGEVLYPAENLKLFYDFTDYDYISYGYQVPDGEQDEKLGWWRRYDIEQAQEQYSAVSTNPFLLATEKPLSTFSIDVDTASYANIRRFLTGGSLPPRDAVRIEEMINYFNYDYPLPTGDDPFSVTVEVADCPWNADHRLARIGIKGWEFEDEDRPAANLVFLIDVSGSMQQPNKLPLVKKSLELLVSELADDDQVAMVVYAGASGLVLDSTPCKTRSTIFDALDRLQAGGGTNGAAGIQLAYDVAEENFIEGGINRVILATDGDFNVGVTSRDDLTSLIEEKAKTGVFLSVLGFGMGNLKDATLETLADKGNGNYAYIDTLNEAKKVLIEQMGGTLITIAKDVKIQVEFNPLVVSAYRLIGYENRLLAARDFNDDTKDAGEIGAGHTVTAFYEIAPVGIEPDLPDVDPLKYQEFAGEPSEAAETGELMTLKLRYKQPDGDVSRLMEFSVRDDGASLADSSADFRFASAVASFGMLLRHSPHAGGWTLEAAAELAAESIGEDPAGYRREFLGLIERAADVMDDVAANVPGYVGYTQIESGRTRVLDDGAGEPHVRLQTVDGVEGGAGEGLALITGRPLYTSWDGASIGSEEADQLHREESVLINPRDAEASGVAMDDEVVLTDGTHELAIRVRLDDGVAPGTVYVPHYYDGGALMRFFPLEGTAP